MKQRRQASLDERRTVGKLCHPVSRARACGRDVGEDEDAEGSEKGDDYAEWDVYEQEV